MHVDVAVEKEWESAKRIALLNAWREAGSCTQRAGRAALALTDAGGPC
ncbi:hypothetical protein [Streptomyces sp. KL116D]